MARVLYTQCTRCMGIFREETMTECYSQDGHTWLADLCIQCLDGWHQFEAFVGEHE